ncbi:MAG: hypothetical protein II416_05050 [Prevotella sp.]|nr:hypothetical protein [Prevotella sp.]
MFYKRPPVFLVNSFSINELYFSTPHLRPPVRPPIDLTQDLPSVMRSTGGLTGGLR